MYNDVVLDPTAPAGEADLRILVTGSRDILDTDDKIREVLCDAVAALRFRGNRAGKIVLVHGACRGLDLRAARIAESMGWATEAHPANWYPNGSTGRLDRSAGPRRNAQMCDLGAHVVVGFPTVDRGAGSRGTWGCLREATSRNMLTVARTTDLAPHGFITLNDPAKK